MRNPPPGYIVLPNDEADSLIKTGDLLWHEDDAEWQEASPDEIGDYVSGYYGVARRGAGAK